jgi:hypothetical protein
MQRFRALGHKVLHIAVDKAHHSPLTVKPPCNKLSVRGKYSVRKDGFIGVEFMWCKIFIELSY